jgi:hypothetical protein
VNWGNHVVSSNPVIREIDSSRLRERARDATPFPHAIIDDFLDADFVHEVLRSWPSYQKATKIGQDFRSLNERNKVQVTDSAQFPQALTELNEVLASPAFVDTLSSIFDIPDLLADAELEGDGLHRTRPPGRLDVHVDFNYIRARKLHRRRLNILTYFNEGWLREWGRAT